LPQRSFFLHGQRIFHTQISIAPWLATKVAEPRRKERKENPCGGLFAGCRKVVAGVKMKPKAIPIFEMVTVARQENRLSVKLAITANSEATDTRNIGGNAVS